MKLSSFRYLVGQGFDNVWKNRVMAFASFCVLLVSLLLVGISVLFYININSVIGGIEQKNEVIVYISDTASQDRISEIGASLTAMKNVSEVTLFTKDEAFAELKTNMSEYTEVFESLDENPLLDSYRVRVTDISEMKETVDAAAALKDVDSVRSPDTFVELLTEVRRMITIISTGIIIAMLVVSMVIISNTTRASVFARRREISIMQSVGATKSFIRFPFFVEGMINGFLAGVVATMLTWFTYDSMLSLLGRFNVLSTFGLGSIIPYEKIAVYVTLAYVIGGSLIGAFGSVLSTRVHLKYRAANM